MFQTLPHKEHDQGQRLKLHHWEDFPLAFVSQGHPLASASIASGVLASHGHHRASSGIPEYLRHPQPAEGTLSSSTWLGAVVSGLSPGPPSLTHHVDASLPRSYSALHMPCIPGQLLSLGCCSYRLLRASCTFPRGAREGAELWIPSLCSVPLTGPSASIPQVGPGPGP